MRVKICGITNPADARTACDAGADYIGLVFVPASKRQLTIEQAQVILANLPGAARSVGLFADAESDLVVHTVRRLGLRVVQLHGSERPEYVNRLLESLPDCQIIKAMRISGRASVAQLPAYYRAIADQRRVLAFLLDSARGGGTGETFNWQETADALDGLRADLPAIFLAGGLTVGNVAEAIRILRPDGVDVSSGVEKAPGLKDAVKVRAFIEQARQG